MSQGPGIDAAAAAPAAEDNIALDGGLDTFEAESNEGKDASVDGTFNPQHISLESFRQLLSCYATTIEQVHRCKAMLKLQPKPGKESKAKVLKSAESASSKSKGTFLPQKTDTSPSEAAHIDSEVEKFLKLDKWRYDEMPKIVAERIGGKGDYIMDKDDLLTVMSWKTSHGRPRPTLMGMIKSNQTKPILKCTEDAVKSIPEPSTILPPTFPKSSMDALQPLRGVGIATASLILSIVTGARDPSQQVPFYSDDLYLWLCLREYPDTEPEESITAGTAAPTRPKKKPSKSVKPNGDLNVRYNMAEYKQLWAASWDLRERLNEEVKKHGGEAVSHNDIEKVAYVLRNIAVSRFYPGVEPEKILKVQQEAVEAAAQAETDAFNATAEGITSNKRKREDREEKKSKKGPGGRDKKEE